ncbi:hypothetical protein BW721_10795 [Jeotgalibaca sp. PTS2502]|uniref:metal ABC transporter substrate-binding protein n=1 Tax=Jeotgalibaca sp. PTS2502 TaxID=1903686 RepID=UPI0009738907|nr:metal ABC transporter substrate-binding protein [Jeotgalibaca sp. PTS2502]APZ50069.1 hypothetical protein BW721_10795 [Jeotgalibaca sp. PTS2502]
MRRLNKIRTSIVALLATVVLASCQTSNQASPSSEQGLSVVTTFYPVYEFTKQVVGENGTIMNLLSAGQDSHSYEPTPKELAQISEADVFVYSSDYMESWVPDVLATLADSDVLVIEATADMDLYENEDGLDHDHDQSHAVDPHVWLDPVLAQDMVEHIAEEISAIDPEQATSYQENAQAYIEELQQLDADYQEAFEGAEHRIFVVQHAAFGYLAKRYQLEEMPISSLTSDQEVSPSKMAEIGRFINENDIKAIYYQDSASSKVAETLAAETGVEREQLSAIEGITTADLEAGANYMSVMRDNLEALQKTIH